MGTRRLVREQGHTEPEEDVDTAESRIKRERKQDLKNMTGVSRFSSEVRPTFVLLVRNQYNPFGV